MIKEKKLYLCNGCKVTGVKSYRCKVFEDFYCPRCQKVSTLFLPPPGFQKEKSLSPNYSTEPEGKISPLLIQEAVIVREIFSSKPIMDANPIEVDFHENSTEKGLFSIRDVFIFVGGLIIGLLIINTIMGR